MVILAHSKLKNVKGSGNNPQLATNSGGLPHYQFQIKSAIWADLIGLFSPVLSPVVPAELPKRVICACILEICFFRDFMGLKSHRSLLARHRYTKQLACEPVSQLLSRMEHKNDQCSQLKVYIQKHASCCCCFYCASYARTNNAKNSWQLKQRSIWKHETPHETKLMTCHYKQAARETI